MEYNVKLSQVDWRTVSTLSQISILNDTLDHVGKFLPGERLEDNGVEVRHIEIAVRFDIGGLRYDRDIRESRILLHGGGELGTVHFRHPHIGQDQVDRLFFEKFERFLAGVGCGHVAVSDLLEKRLRDAEVHRDVVDDENSDRFHVTRNGLNLCFGLSHVRLGSLCTVAHCVERDRERTSFAILACAGQLAIHAGRQTFGDGESEASSVFHGIGIAHPGELNERFHELLLVILRDADAGVGDGAFERAGIHGIGVGREGDMERYGALLRELDGVAEKVDEDLADADVVNVKFREVFGDIGNELIFVLLGAEGEDEHDLAAEGVEIGERGDDLHLLRLKLGEVEDIVDEHEQGVCRGGNGVEVFHLLIFGNAAFAEKFGEPDDGVQRRTDLVADAGDEEALRFVCGQSAYEKILYKKRAQFSV